MEIGNVLTFNYKYIGSNKYDNYIEWKIYSKFLIHLEITIFIFFAKSNKRTKQKIRKQDKYIECYM